MHKSSIKSIESQSARGSTVSTWNPFKKLWAISFLNRDQPNTSKPIIFGESIASDINRSDCNHSSEKIQATGTMREAFPPSLPFGSPDSSKAQRKKTGTQTLLIWWWAVGRNEWWENKQNNKSYGFLNWICKTQFCATSVAVYLPSLSKLISYGSDLIWTEWTEWNLSIIQAKTVLNKWCSSSAKCIEPNNQEWIFVNESR